MDHPHTLHTNLMDPYDPSAFPANPIPKVVLAMPSAVAEFRGPNHTIHELVPGFESKSVAQIVADENLKEETIDTTGIPSSNVLMEEQFGSESVCGTDDRVPAGSPNTWPWASFCSLLMTWGSKQYTGTGWLIGPNTVMTAGHNLYDKSMGWASSVKVMPGRNGSSLPFGSSMATQLWSVKGWVDYQYEAYDYGCVIIGDKLGQQTGWIGYGVFPDSVLLGQNDNITGYPGDKPAGTMWYAAGKISSADGLRLYYMLDTFRGESGSPVWMTDYKSSQWGVGIHNYGGCPNKASRITQPVFQNMVYWANL